MAIACPSCGREATLDSRYCSGCGRSLLPLSTSEAGPTWTASKEASLRPVTVLFCDLKGSTELISQLQSETALRILSTATDAMAGAVQAAGGAVLKRMGDGVMAVFGVPVAQPDHALRACRAALNIVPAVAAAFAQDEEMNRYRPALRIGRAVTC